MTKLYIGNLSYNTTSDDLRTLLGDYSSLQTVDIIMDRASGRSKGFGFAEFDDDEEAKKVIEEFNGKEVDGRTLVVNVARPKEDRPRGNFGGNRGGFRN